MTLLGAPLAPACPPTPWQFAGLTHTGRVRANNEDAIAFDPLGSFAILADGMGGHNGGEIASAMTVAALQDSVGGWLARSAASSGPGDAGLVDDAGPSVHRLLQASVDQANKAVYQTGMGNSQLEGMGTTLVLALFGSRRVVIGHIGDSRCYRLRAGQLELLTRDHSRLREQLDAGVITQAEADRSPNRNVVTRAIGVGPRVLLEMHDHDARPGDLLLLCSDGLNDMVGEAELCGLLLRDVGLPDKARLLVAAANENGGCDNISVVLAQPRDPAPGTF